MREQPGIPEEQLRACLQDQYDLYPFTLEFLPLGLDYNAGVYRVVSEQSTAYLLKVTSRPLYEPRCLVPRYLKDQGITSVVAPVPTRSGALKFHENAPGEIKRMWVAPRMRGLGLGRRMLLALEHYAREAGVVVLHLETNRTLIEAIQLYRDCGYQEVAAFNDEPYAHHWFEKHL